MEACEPSLDQTFGLSHMLVCVLGPALQKLVVALLFTNQ